MISSEVRIQADCLEMLIPVWILAAFLKPLIQRSSLFSCCLFCCGFLISSYNLHSQYVVKWWLVTSISVCFLFVRVVFHSVWWDRDRWPQINPELSDRPRRQRCFISQFQRVHLCSSRNKMSAHINPTHWAQVVVTFDLSTAHLCRSFSLDRHNQISLLIKQSLPFFLCLVCRDFST